MDIRLATPRDVAAVRACAEAAYQIYVAAIGRKPAPMVADFEEAQTSGQLYVAADEDGVAGFAVFYQRDDHVHLENIAVNPDRQGKGVGRKLVAYVEHQAVKLNANRIELYTNEKMTGNLSWYPKLGYEEVGRWREDGFDRVFFRKLIGNS